MQYIIQHDGVYNIYCTVSDGVFYEGGCNLQEIVEYTRFKFGQSGMIDLPNRIERADKTGCSAIGWTLDDCISGNRAGPNEKRLTKKEFIERFFKSDEKL